MGLIRRLFIPDSHFNQVDRQAFLLMLDVVRAFKPHEVVYLGDFFDLSSLSSHEKDVFSDVQYLKDELQAGREAIEVVEKVSKADSFVFIEGNHSYRLRRYISNRAPQLAGLLNTKEIFGIPPHYKYFEYGQSGHYKMGNLIATHGTFTGKNSASQYISRYGSSVIHGHDHRLAANYISSLDSQFVCISGGFLGKTKEAGHYIKDVPDWQHGFVITWHKPNGQFWFQLIHIQKGKRSYECLFGNEVFQR